MKKFKLLTLGLATLLITGCNGIKNRHQSISSITENGSSVQVNSENSSSQNNAGGVVNSSSTNGTSNSISSINSTNSVNSVSSNKVTSSSSSLGVSISIDPSKDPYKGNYYDSITDSMSGEALQIALYKVTSSTHNPKSYNDLWNAYRTTDVYPGTTIIWDIYSNYKYEVGKDQAGTYSQEGDCYNREHSIPQSWFNKASPMVSDVHHIYPTDGKVNGMRSNYPYGEVSNPSYTSGNGSKLGSSSFPGYSGKVFEPIDEYKGDLARTYFYFATRYPGKAVSGEGANIFTTSFPYLTKYALNLFAKWSVQDPVSQKEIDRNNAAAVHQGNRNPYIDHPSYISRVFGAGSGGTSITPVTPSSSVVTPTLNAVKPVVNKNYKIGMEIGSTSNMLFFIGSTTNYTYYLATSNEFEQGCNCQIENANGGYYISYSVGGYKMYINMIKSGTHYNIDVSSDPSTVWTYDEEYKTFTSLVEGEKCYIGTHDSYTTISCSKYSNIQNSYPVHFYEA